MEASGGNTRAGGAMGSLWSRGGGEREERPAGQPAPWTTFKSLIGNRDLGSAGLRGAWAPGDSN